METKQRILDAALTLFAEKGYSDVYVSDIAAAVGIRAPSLYKHYKSKRDIFDAILAEMKAGYEKQAAALQMDGSNAAQDAGIFSSVSEETLVRMGTALFLYFLHDPYICRFRKMLTIEQFHNSELADLYCRQYADEPLAYQEAIFRSLCAKGLLAQADPRVMALQFFAPIYMMLTVCDRHPDREAEALQLIERHICQFCRIYKGGTEQ